MGPRRLLLCAVIVPVVVLVTAWAQGRSPHAGDNLGDWSTWQPTASEITAAMDANRAGVPEAGRQAVFVHMFQRRFRSHGAAIGVKFRPRGRLQLLCAAMLPRWDMAHIAVALHAEALHAFAVDYPVDIYETFIGSPTTKTGELHSGPGPAHVTVRFDPPYPLTAEDRAIRARQSRRRWVHDPNLLFGYGQPFIRPAAAP